LNLRGATCGATVAFLVARYLAAEWVVRKAGGRLGRMIAGVEAEDWRFVAFVRLVPLFPFNLSNYALGLTRIPLGHYVLASLLCMAPGTIAYTWLGYAGREALAGDATAVWYGVLGIGLLAAIAFLPRLLRRLRGAPAWIWATDLKRRLDAGEPMTVVDVRGPDEYRGPLGHIREACNLPVDELPDRMAELGHTERRPLVLVCRTDRRSARAAETLRGAGFVDVAVLHGGMEQWNRAGLPIEGRLAQEGQKGHRA
jgi:rhodanese-related sulfurtransferase